jgi:hypothetical protein
MFLVRYLFIKMFYVHENLPSLADAPKSQFAASSARGNVGSLCVILVPHAVQRKKLFRAVMSKK